MSAGVMAHNSVIAVLLHRNTYMGRVLLSLHVDILLWALSKYIYSDPTHLLNTNTHGF